MRGSSDAYGSWNTICIARRSARSARREQCAMSSPSNAIVPGVGSSSRTQRAAIVDLPQPDSPTSAERLAARRRRTTRRRPRAPTSAGARRKSLTRSSTSSRTAHGVRTGCIGDLVGEARHAARWCRPAGRAAAALRGTRRSASGQRGWNAAARRQRERVGGVARDRRRAPPRGSSTRVAPTASRPRVYGCRGRANTSSTGPSSTTRPAYITRRGRRCRRRRRGRG